MLTKEKTSRPKFANWLRSNWIYILIYVFFLYVSCTSARAGDDWDLASSWYVNGFLSTSLSMIRAITYFNGRIVANIFATFFAYYDILWRFIAPIIFTGIIYLSNRLFKNERKLIPVSISFLMMLCVSNSIRLETYTNIVGNATYIPEILLIFLYLNIIFNENSNKLLRIWQNEKLNCMSVALLAFITGLWVENITIGLLAANILLAILAIIKNRKLSPYVSYGMIGSILSCIVMFGTPGYSMRVSYYSEAGVGIIQRISINLPVFLEQLGLENISVYFLCFIIIAIVMFSNKIHSSQKILDILYRIFTSLVVIIFSAKIFLQLLVDNYFYSTQNPIIIKILNLINKVIFDVNKPYTIIFWLASLLFILIPVILSLEKEKLFVLYCIGLISAGVMIGAPYLGGRTFIFAIYMLVSITAYLTSLIEIKLYDIRKALILVLILAIGVQMEKFFYYGKYVMETETIRLQLIEDFRTRITNGRTLKDEWLVLPAYKKDSVIDTGNPTVYEFHMRPLKNYYHLPQEANVVIDDGFGYKAFNLLQENNSVYRFEVIPLKNILDYTYTFIVRQNNEVIYKSVNKKDNFDNFYFQNAGTYEVTCVLSHKIFGQKVIYAKEPIIIK